MISVDLTTHSDAVGDSESPGLGPVANACLTLDCSDLRPNCVHCGEPCAEYVTGLIHDGHVIGDPELCGPYEWSDVLPEDTLLEHLPAGRAAELLAEEGVTRAELPTRLPPTAVNWIDAAVNADGVVLSVSLGDPRGAFTMEVWQGRNPATGEPCTYLKVPHPRDSAPHMRLTPHGSDGTYIVG